MTISSARRPLASSLRPRTARRPAEKTLEQRGPRAQLGAGRLGHRIPQLVLGLALYGVTLALIIRAGLGNAPWDVLHQGIAMRTPLSIGLAVIATSAVVLLAWIPLREFPGLGTIANALTVGLFTDLALFLIPEAEVPLIQVLMLAAGVVGNAFATALYLGSRFGSGPRDGLMTGLHRRTGVSIRAVRTGLEVGVVTLGWLLGGPLGIGTVAYALLIGPLTQQMLAPLRVRLAGEPD